ncbi:MAG: tRNA epoxyqueuosine(34) reductase QueG [Bacteroidetes bacterium]|nr:tRNA epoxyqueuosine(34) reductase QueG [Bacteroidota bacterium]MBU1718668.1 tRNA epoxyqueuosine(34) reductase QueG [Bacteroidota bacterium]
MDIKAQIKQKAYDAGFSGCGFTGVELPQKDAERLNIWLHRNYNALMQWMERNIEKRSNVVLLEPWAKGVVVFTLPYYHEENRNSEKYSVSRYALGEDYHQVVKQKLLAIEEEIHNLNPEAITRAFCDTAPILERAFARQAGLGWIGKNTCLITPDSGSYVFIGIILTNIVLGPDSAESSLCGDCRLCIDSCPANALSEDGFLDANRCISYLTIEHRGEIMQHDAEIFGNRIFGCDTCQEVCPHNISILSHGNAAFRVTTSQEQLINGIMPGTNDDIWHKSSFARTGYDGIQRNIELVAKNKAAL